MAPAFLEMAPGFPEMAPAFLEMAPGFLEMAPGFLGMARGFLEMAPGFLEIAPGFLETKRPFPGYTPAPGSPAPGIRRRGPARHPRKASLSGTRALLPGERGFYRAGRLTTETRRHGGEGPRVEG